MPALREADPGIERVLWFEKRLSTRPLQTVGEVASAFDVSPHTVRGWIESGDLTAYNSSSGATPYWKVFRDSAVSLFKRRISAGSGG